ncbi:MAG: RsmG family class I SAM-dependent methyltransferase, partial [Planctomycetota bacterium]
MNEFNQALEHFQIAAPELESDEVRDRIQQYCVLLWHKNQVMNLTRHTTWDAFVSRDLVDTLQISKLIPEDQEVLDVGSGGGVPGLLLAILRPDLEISLSESVGKKALALAEFAEVTGVHVQIYRERAEKLLDDFRFDCTIARAVGSLSKFCRLFEDRWLNVNRLLAIKGPNWTQEKKEADEAGVLHQ